MKVMSTPKSVDIEITNRCNLRCKYCSHFGSAGDVNQDLPTEEWLKFFEELNRCTVIGVTLAGGEPFFREYLEELIEGVVKNRMRFSILSNGTLITDEMAAFLASTRRCKGPEKFLNYMGASMNPVLMSGDELHVVPYNGQKIRSGDVIVFIPPGKDQKIVHRVVSIDSQGIRTKGDNNNRFDPWVINPDHIIGRAVCAKKGNRQRRVFGGLRGQFIALGVRAIRIIDSGIFSLLRPAYYSMVRSGVFRRLMARLIVTRVVSFNRPEGMELKLLLGRHEIGSLPSGRKKWYIRPPFRLFVDEASLPGRESFPTSFTE